MQRGDAESLISIAAAARELGLNRSTLTRQIKKGAVRSHEGKVILVEVIADRGVNIYPGRSRRHLGLTDGESLALDAATKRRATPADVASKIPITFGNPAAAVVAQLLGRACPIYAEIALKAGCSVAQAYALAGGIQMGLFRVANELLIEDGGPGFDMPGAYLSLEDGVFQDVDWDALATRVGEPVDHDAWCDFAEEHGL